MGAAVSVGAPAEESVECGAAAAVPGAVRGTVRGTARRGGTIRRCTDRRACSDRARPGAPAGSARGGAYRAAADLLATIALTAVATVMILVLAHVRAGQVAAESPPPYGDVPSVTAVDGPVVPHYGR